MSNYRVENLHPFYTYSFSIAAVTVEAGPRSRSISLQTAEASEFRVWYLTSATHNTGMFAYISQFPVALHRTQWLQLYHLTASV